MKRSLSLFLSLVLLVSVLVVPMTAFAEWKGFNTDDLNAAGAQNGYTCTLEKFTNDSGASGRYNYNNNLLRNLTPKLSLTSKSGVSEVSSGNFSRLADNVLGSNSDISLNSQAFVNDGVKDSSGNVTAFANGYVPTDEFNFDNEKITTYADIVYDLGGYFSISQIQHFTSNSTSNNRTGIYQIYAAKTEAELFESESLLINYQIKSDNTDNTKTEKENSQDFKFTDKDKQPTARYFAFRVLCPVAAISSSTFAKDIRITELAVYGTESDKVFDVTVNREPNNNIGIKYEPGSECELDAAEVGKNVKFTLDLKTIPNGVTVTVKYGGVKKEPVDGVYTITVEKDKELDIIPSHVPKQFSKSEAATYFNADDSTRVSDDLSPVIFVTYEENDTQVRKQVGYKANYETNIPALSDGNISVKNDITVGDYFNGTNGYTSGNYTADFVFNNNNITNYVDIIYDLGCTVNVNKIQHFAANGNNSLGLYQVYAAEDVNNLFKDESWVLNYQNKQVSGTYYGCQQHEFVAKPARFVAFRILCPVTVPSNTANTLRIFELAIYGTKVGTDPGYTVTPVPDFNGWISGGSETGNVGDNNLLKLNNLTVNGKGDGKEVELKVSTEKQGHLHNGVYGGHRTGFMDAVHADINLVQFYDLNNNQFKNGYNISRDANGNITFEQTGDITDYVCMTYDLGDYYKLKEFQLYSANGDLNYDYISKMQAYEVYVGTDKETLYNDDNRVAKYDNYFNVYGQVIKFTNPRTGCYLGVKVLMPSMYANTNNYIRLSEIAAFGDLVGEPTAESKLAPAELTSKSGYIYNKDGSSVFDYTNSNDETVKGTALRLTVGYKSPKVPGGANASKIVLANGKTANVIERNVIAIAKSKYTAQGLSTLDIDTEGASVTTSTATSTKHPVSNYFKSEAIKDDNDYCMAYGALNINNISETNASKEVVVRGRVVYEYNGEIYAVYSNIVGDDAEEVVSAESAYKILCKNIADANGGTYNSPLWFNDTKWNGSEFESVQ